jgi:hypothetical protein
VEAGTVLLEITGELTDTRSPSSFQIGPGEHLETDSVAKVINHSCKPSCFLRLTEEKALQLVAVEDLADGDELTVDYASFEDNRPSGGRECSCGSDSCRGRLVGFRDLSPDQQRNLDAYLLPYLQP